MIMKTLAAAAVTMAFCITPASANPNDDGPTPKRFVGTYVGQGQTDTVSGPFGTFTCVDFQQFSPDLICENYSMLELRADGTASTTIGGTGPFSDSFGKWQKTGRRQLEINWVSLVYDANGEASQWAQQKTTLTFNSSRTQVTTSFEINWFPITDDPKNPMSPPDITFNGSGSLDRYNFN